MSDLVDFVYGVTDKNKCISEGLMHVTARYSWSPGPNFTKFGEYVSTGQIHNAAKFSCAPIRSVPDIPCQSVCSRKSVPMFTKIGDDLLRSTAPHRAKCHRARPNNVREKRYNFYTLQIETTGQK